MSSGKKKKTKKHVIKVEDGSTSFLHLPIEILLKIFDYLQFCDVQNIILTCQTFRDLLLNDKRTWKRLSNHEFLICSSTDNNQPLGLSPYNHIRVSQNWRKGIFKTSLILRQNTNYMPWIQYFGSKHFIIAIGSEIICYPTNRKGTLNYKDIQWSIKVPIVKRSDIRTNDVSRFKLRNSVLVSGNRDGCTSVYSISNSRQKPKLLCHIRNCHEYGEKEVSAVELIMNSQMSYAITSSDRSPELCFFRFDTEENQFARVINIPETIGLKCLAANIFQDKLAIGLNGGNVPIILDINSGRLLLSGDGLNRRSAVRDIQWHDENTITYVTHSGTMQSIDARTNEVVFEVEDPFQSSFYCLKTDGDRAIVVGSSEYSRCVLFDSRYSGRYVQMYFTQKRSSPIYSLDFNSTNLIAAADRGVALLNYNVNSSSNEIRDYSNPFELVKHT